MDSIFYDELRQLLICKPCGKAISPGETQVMRHLSRHHMHDMGVKDRQSIGHQFRDVEALEHDSPGLAAAQKLGFHPLLPITSGYKCTFEGCSYMCPTKEAIRNHITAQETHQEGLEPKYTVVPAMQTFFQQPWISYFEVVPPIKITDPDTMVLPAIPPMPLGERIERFQQARQVVLRQVPTEVRAPEITLWDQKTQWFAMFPGQDMDRLRKMCSIPQLDRVLQLEYITTEILLILQEAQGRAQTEQEHVLCLFRSIDQTMSTRPLRIIHTNSESSYFGTWVKVILYLIQTFPERIRLRIDFNSTQEVLLEAIWAALSPSRVVNSKELCDLLWRLSISLIQQPVEEPHRHPIIHCVGVLGYNTTSGVWMSASEHRPTLSRLIYCVRILSIRDFQEKVISGKPRSEQAREYIHKYIIYGSDTMFTTIQSQRTYAKVLAKDFYAHPTVIWSRERDYLYYKGLKVELGLLKGLVHQWYTECKDTLLDNLLFTTEGHLLLRQPSQFHDSMAWTPNGHSLYDQNPQIHQSAQETLERARTSKGGKRLYQELTAESGSSAAIRDYELTYTRFLERILLLTYVGIGGPPRGTEILCAAFANGWSSIRSILVIQEALGIVSWYNKTEAVSEVPRIIARFFPDCLASVVISLIVDVIPFRHTIAALSNKKPETTVSPLIWQTKGEPWTTERLSKALGRETESALGVRLTVSSWRHVAIAIDKEIIQRQGTHPNLAVNHTLQAGHGADVEDHHYALNVNMLLGLSQEAIEGFRDVSRLWAAFWQMGGPGAAGSRGRREPDSATAPISDRLLEKVEEIHDYICGTKLAGPTEGIGALTNIFDKVPPKPQVARAAATYNTPATTGPLTNIFDKAPTTGSTVTQPQFRATDILRPLQLLYGRNQYRSQDQEDAVRHVATTTEDIIVQLPTGAGKSLAITIPAFMSSHLVTLVCVPYNTLRRELIQHCNARGLSAHYWSGAQIEEATLVFMVPENASHARFDSYLATLVEERRLRRVVFDECHHLVEDAGWRQSWDRVADSISCAQVPVQRVFLSATLPQPTLQNMMQVMTIKAGCRHIRQSVVRGNIYHAVHKVDGDRAVIHTLQGILEDCRIGDNPRVLIYVMNLTIGQEISRATGISFYYAGLPETDKIDILRAFQDGQTNCMITTGACSDGVNLGVGHIIHYRGSFDLITYMQQAGRGGRDGERSSSISLLSHADMRRLQASGRDEVVRFLQTEECRRTILSASFDGVLKTHCSAPDVLCDNCTRPRGGTTALVSPAPRAALYRGFATETPRPPHWAFQHSIRSSAFCTEAGASPQYTPPYIGNLRATGDSARQALWTTPPRPQGRTPGRIVSPTPSIIPETPTPSRQGILGLTSVGEPFVPPGVKRPALVTSVERTRKKQQTTATWSPAGPSNTQRESETLETLAIHGIAIRQSALVSAGEEGPEALTNIILKLQAELFPDMGSSAEQRQRSDQVLFAAVQAAKLVSSSICVTCWLNGYGGQDHGWRECKDLRLEPRDIQKVRETLQRTNGGMTKSHFKCYLPTGPPFHAVGSSFALDCQWQDIVREFVCLAWTFPRYYPIFAFVGVDPSRESLLGACTVFQAMSKSTPFRGIIVAFIYIVLIVESFYLLEKRDEEEWTL